MEGNEIRLRGRMGEDRDRAVISGTHTEIVTFYVYVPTGRRNRNGSIHETCLRCAVRGKQAWDAYNAPPDAIIEVTGSMDWIGDWVRGFHEVRVDTFKVL